MLLAFAWRNLWRRPQRTILSLLSIAFVTALLIFALSFMVGVYGAMKENTLRIFDGYAQIQPIGYADDPTVDRTIANVSEVTAQARALPGVTVAAPRINSFGILAHGIRSFGASIVGVDPGSEHQMSSLARAIRQGRYLTASDDDAAIMGETLADNLNLHVGDKVTMLGTAHDGSVAADVLKVVGIFNSGIPGIDRSLLEMPFRRAQETFAMAGLANTIALYGPSLNAVNKSLPALHSVARRHNLTVRDWGQMQPSLRDIIRFKYASSLVLFLTMILVVAFIILNTLLMSVLERTREFGILLALGMRMRQVGQTVWIELLVLALLGSAIGLAIGVGVSFWLAHRGIVIPGIAQVTAQFGLPSRLYPELTLFSTLTGSALILLFILLGGIIPHLRISRLVPALAMRAA